MLRIDGAVHSGSGTLVRTSLALAAVLGRELRIVRVRARREPPGLRTQHAHAVRALAAATGGEARGAEVGSDEVVFVPGSRAPERLSVEIPTAGSATLAAIALLPAAALLGIKTLRLTGGLFQDFAPTAFHLKEVLLPLLARMGLHAEAEILRPGYVPTGGGKIALKVEPCRGLKAVRLAERGKVRLVHGMSLASRLAGGHVADRMADACGQALRSKGLHVAIETWDDDSSIQPGAALAAWAECEHSLLGADLAGKLGRPSERIGLEVARRLWQDLDSGAAVDRHAADMLVPFLALAEGESEVWVPDKTEHLESNLRLAEQIAGASWNLERLGGGRRGWSLTVRGVGFRP